MRSLPYRPTNEISWSIIFLFWWDREIANGELPTETTTGRGRRRSTQFFYKLVHKSGPFANSREIENATDETTRQAKSQIMAESGGPNSLAMANMNRTDPFVRRELATLYIYIAN
jgi:hypothetical protein